MSTTESGAQTAAAAGACTPAEVLEFASDRAVEMVDLKFVDLPGTWQHMTLPIRAIEADDFESGLGFDGSSIRGFQEIHESDMLLIPDASSAFIDPYYTRPTPDRVDLLVAAIRMRPHPWEFALYHDA